MGAAANGERKLASIIVPCFNQLEFTHHCVPALMRYTRKPWELIVVDNGSTDGTAPYLAGVRDAAPLRVEIITNPANRGFPAACNQGLKAARGDVLVLLNNDAVVTHDWLDQLVALADSDPKIGLTGPMSNYAAPPQLVEHVPYADLDGMHRFAGHWREAHRGQWFTTGKLSGFCLLLKRKVLETLGGLDERFGLGFFDDDDLALRAKEAGFSLAVAHDLFVHHFGSRTFAGARIDAESLLAENQAKFQAKWGLREPAGRRVTLSPWSSPPRLDPPRVRRSGGRPKVSLTMIVRNEEQNLPACLASAEGLFDELVIVDTGSTDRTAEIARTFGARVFDFVWVDDFAAARNAALARARGDYAFWLDADDVLEPPERDKLKGVLSRLGETGETAYVVRCACDPDSSGGGGATVVDHIRLFPVREDVRWTYRVHEQILPALRVADVPVRWTDVVVRHTGYADRALRRRKLGRDEAILRGELEERPDDPFVLFNLGSIAIELQDWPTALGHLQQSLAGSAPTDSITRKLYALIARCYQMTGDPGKALETCAAGLAVDPDDAELHFREAVVRRNHGDAAGAERCWRRILTLSRPERFASVDPGIYGHLTRRNLAALAEDRGDPAEATRLWKAVLAECPGDSEALRKLRLMECP
ncbi:MAG: glycosyltransferase [Isosphaeraceae bacterium]|nr:glycosyltransferase [Isosphaeraceae bacterium]